MNIQQAKEQIRKTCVAYLSKDEFGDYIVPVETQRPVFLVGAPGIGKTAIMAQVAKELGLGLVDYSMTHHTRQSAIGLPVISQRSYGGAQRNVSEYTMSEIIASVYDAIERTGKREGILFLDEVNCVSETLAPAMLRFLQSKVFGSERVPDGWVVTCAGNPLEYNRSAKQFDIVTLDRVKRIEVEPDFGAWRDYARSVGAHSAVVSYLSLRPDNFYHVETQGRKQNFVTARAWMDLSNMMKLYERHGLEIDAELVEQYVQVPAIAKDFVTYLELFAAYSADYRLSDILAGEADDELRGRARSAGFDERTALVSLLVDAMAAKADDVMADETALSRAREAIVAVKEQLEGGEGDVPSLLNARADALADAVRDDALTFRGDHAARHAQHEAIGFLREAAGAEGFEGGEPLERTVALFNERLAAHRQSAAAASAAAENGLRFVADAFGQGNELVVCLSDMTMHTGLSQLVANHGCPAYFEYNDALMLDGRDKDLDDRLESLAERIDEAQKRHSVYGQ